MGIIYTFILIDKNQFTSLQKKTEPQTRRNIITCVIASNYGRKKLGQSNVLFFFLLLITIFRR